jgi:hypothetical protein
MPVIVVKKDLGLIEKAILKLTKSEVLIGIPDSGSARQPDPGEPAPPSNAVIGYIQEFGAPERNIPARPFLVPGVESITPKAAELLRKAGRAALFGDSGAVETALNQIGLIGQSAVQQKITDGPFAPLSERTLKARKARKRTGEKPLIDTGQLRRSVTYIVRRKGS